MNERDRRECKTSVSATLQCERGAVTAEFAVVLPAVLVIFVLAVSAILLGAHRVVLTSAAAEIARLEARGDVSAAQGRLVELSGVTVEREQRGRLHCVALRSRPAGGLLSAVEVSASGCAARVDSDLVGL